MKQFSNTIIYLIGFAGTGKYTIAKEIAKIADFRVVDNHLINNPIFTVVQIDGKNPVPEEVWVKVREVKKIVFDTIIELSPPEFNFVFTNELVEGNPKALDSYQKIEELAIKRNSTFIPVRLLCEVDELAKRISTDERTAMYKVTDKARAYNMVKEFEVLRPNHPNTITIDVTDKSPFEAAKLIIEKTSIYLGENL
jgi:shikimate kinase